MKKQLSTIVVGALLLLSAIPACTDQDAPQSQVPVLTTGTATVGGRTIATLTGSITFSGETEITECGFIYSTVSTLPEAESSIQRINPASLPGTCTVTLTGLSPATHYYYCLYASSGYTELRSDIREFDTATDGVPAFDEVVCSDITASSVTTQGILTDDGGHEIITLGFCYKRVEDINDETLDLEDNVVNVNPSDTVFSAVLQDLRPGYTYLVRAYGINSLGVGYGPVTTFVTQLSDPPVPSSVTQTGTTTTGIIVESYLLSDGSSEVTEVGFCWSAESETPTTDMLHQSCIMEDENKTFSLLIEGMSAETTYHIRAYAINSYGTGYGPVYAFTTPATPSVVDIKHGRLTDTSVYLSARIEDDGGGEIVEKGFCYTTDSTMPPTKDNSTIVQDTTEVYNTEEKCYNNIALTIDSLSPSTTYYIRAYASNCVETGYSNTITITTEISSVPGIDDNVSPKRDNQ